MRYEDTIKAFGDRLRKLRAERQLSQQDLADMAEIHKSTIQRIENAEFSPTLETLLAIAKALDISLQELLLFEDSGGNL